MKKNNKLNIVYIISNIFIVFLVLPYILKLLERSVLFKWFEVLNNLIKSWNYTIRAINSPHWFWIVALPAIVNIFLFIRYKNKYKLKEKSSENIELIKNIGLNFIFCMDLFLLYILSRERILICSFDKKFVDVITLIIMQIITFILLGLFLDYCIRGVLKIQYIKIIKLLIVVIVFGYITLANWQLIALISIFLNIFFNYDNIKNIYLNFKRKEIIKYDAIKRHIEKGEVKNKVKFIIFIATSNIFQIVLYVVVMLTEKTQEDMDFIKFVYSGIYRSMYLLFTMFFLIILCAIFRNRTKDILIKLFELKI